MIISIAAGVFDTRNSLAGELPNAREFAVVGVVLFAAGLALRWWSIITLGRFLTMDVAVDPPSREATA